MSVGETTKKKIRVNLRITVRVATGAIIKVTLTLRISILAR